MSIQEPVRFAVVGCGMLAQSQHIPNIAASSRAVLHTCVDLDDKALAICQQQFGALHVSKDFRAAIANPEVDAICLAAAEKLRWPVIEAAAQAGKPIYVEKPLASTLEEMYQIRTVVEQAGIPFCVGHNRRSSPAMREAHRIFRQHMTQPKPCPWRFNREGDDRPQLAEDGVAGMSVRINDDWYSWKKRVFDRKQVAFGPMLFEMTHFTDICHWMLDAEPEKVVALEHGMFNHGVVIAYKTGEVATISMSANGTFGYPKELYEMMGHGAMVVVDHMVEVRTAGIVDAKPVYKYPLLGDRLPDVGRQGGIAAYREKRHAACQQAAEQGDPMLQFACEPDKGHARQLDRFIDEMLGKGPVVCGIDDSILATETAFAAIASAHRGQAVTLDEIRADAGASLLKLVTA